MTTFDASDIALVGDVHGRWGVVIERVLALGAKCAVFVGDFEAGKVPSGDLKDKVAPLTAAGVEVLYIHGNHDCDNASLYQASVESLPNACFHGRVVDAGAVRIGGLGGVFRERIWDGAENVVFHSPEDMLKTLPKNERYRNGLPLRHRASIFPSDVEALGQMQCDVLIAHEAPASFQAERHGRRVSGFQAIDDLAARMHAAVIVHGHHHESYSKRVGDLMVVGLGLAEVVMLSDAIARAV